MAAPLNPRQTRPASITPCQLLEGAAQRLYYHLDPFTLTKSTMVAGNQASPSSRGESVCCCAARPCRLACLVCSAATPDPPPPSDPHTASRENQLIWKLPVVMNGGLLQPRLPPQAQTDDCGQLKCFLRHAGGRRTRGKVATGDAPALFNPPLSL